MVWDPAVNDPSFEFYCGNISSDSILYPETKYLRHSVKRLIKLGGYKKEARNLTIRMLNYIGYLNLTTISGCVGSQDDCFSTYQPYFYRKDDITQTWRSWPYQYCTQWGYFQTGSGVPADQLPLVSRTLDIEYFSLICRLAFNISIAPDVGAINKYGGYGLSYPRLAFIDGEQDPWRPATPHASPFVDGVENRTSTVQEPFILIAGAVHHWDEYGLFENETTGKLPPDAVARAQRAEVGFVREWMEEWDRENGVVEKFKDVGNDLRI
jgi:Serine carboxypeptidase S28